MSTIDELVSQYTSAAIEHGIATEASHPKGTVRSARRIVEALRSIEAKAGSRDALVPLLEHPNPYVQLWASTHLIRSFPDEAIRVLEQLAAPPSGYVVGNARTVLSEWRKGRLAPTE